MFTPSAKMHETPAQNIFSKCIFVSNIYIYIYHTRKKIPILITHGNEYWYFDNAITSSNMGHIISIPCNGTSIIFRTSNQQKVSLQAQYTVKCDKGVGGHCNPKTFGMC